MLAITILAPTISVIPSFTSWVLSNFLVIDFSIIESTSLILLRIIWIGLEAEPAECSGLTISPKILSNFWSRYIYARSASLWIAIAVVLLIPPTWSSSGLLLLISFLPPVKHTVSFDKGIIFAYF